MNSLKKVYFIVAMLVFGSLQAEKPAIVVYMDSFVIQAGFAGDDAPKVVLPNVENVSNDKDNASYPIQDGKVVDIAQCEKILGHIFSELKIDPKEHSVLLAYPSNFTKESIEKITKIFFEKFQVPAFWTASYVELILYTTPGSYVALVVCMDNNGVFVNAVNEYSILAAKKIPITSKHLNNYLKQLLEKKGYQFTKQQSEIIEKIKNKYCYVSLNFDSEMKAAKNSSSLSKTYPLDDGQTIEIKEERFIVPEAFFQPKLLGIDAQGVHEVIQEVINKCNKKFRKKLYRKIIVAGSESMYPGLGDRIEYGFYKANKKLKAKVVAIPERKYSIWIGGSILASLSTFKPILRKEYVDHGSFCDLQEKLKQK